MLLGWRRDLWRAFGDGLFALRLIDESRWAYAHSRQAAEDRDDLMELLDDSEEEDDHS
jgi:hypothetical protein